MNYPNECTIRTKQVVQNPNNLNYDCATSRLVCKILAFSTRDY